MSKLDQHFTDKTLAKQLVISLLNRLDPTRIRHYIEPSCGEGAFVYALQNAGIPKRSIRSIEIDPQLPASIHCNFLKTTAKLLRVDSWSPATTIVVGNPPFGCNGALARQFINEATKYAHWICMIVPRSMYKSHRCGNLNPRLTLMHEIELPVDVISGTKAKTCWQEWFLLPEGLTNVRVIKPKIDTLGLYKLVDKNEHHDLVIQRCGSAAGRITHCNGTGEGKYYVHSSYPAVIEAFRHLKTHPQAAKSTHQLSLSAQYLHELFVEAGFQQWTQTLQK